MLLPLLYCCTQGNIERTKLKKANKQTKPESKCVWCTLWFKLKLDEPQKEGNFLFNSSEASVIECWHSANVMSVLFFVCSTAKHFSCHTFHRTISLLSRCEPYLFHRFIKCIGLFKKGKIYTTVLVSMRYLHKKFMDTFNMNDNI